MTREALVLGAGFSVAASGGKLPVTADLGRRATARAKIPRSRLPAGGFDRGRFETWLSRLAEDQPHLSVAENLENRGVFVRVVEQLVAVLAEAEAEAFQGAPGWLFDLLTLAHHRKATLITLNYDGLVEAAVRTLKLPLDSSPEEVVAPEDVLDDFPSGAAGGLSSYRARGLAYREPAPGRSTFRLLKLHGSLDWCWSFGDRTGSTVRRIETRAEFGFPLGEPAFRRKEARGFEPFIVPPTATKSSYYDNPVTRWLWHEAAAQLSQADEITLVGYSFPREDLAMSALIGDAVRGRDDVLLRVVDLNPAGPARHLRRLRRGPVELVKGVDSVERFACAWRDRAAGQLIQCLHDLSNAQETRLLVAWVTRSGRHFDQYVSAIDAEPHDGDLALLPFSVGSAHSIDDGLRLSDLLARLGGANRLVMKLRNEDEGVPLVAGGGQTGVDGVYWVKLWAIGRV